MRDLQEFDEGLADQINYLYKPDLDENEFETNFNQIYSIELTDGTLYDLIQDSSQIRVEFADRFKYAQLALKARLCESDNQIAAVKRGLCKIIPESLLKRKNISNLVLTYQELERLICGVKTVDIDLLKFHTKLSADLNENSNRVKWLWEILREVSDDEKIKFIKFCYAQERLPNTHEEFEKLQIKFTIKSYMDKSKTDAFPKADTCFFSLELPKYTSKETMKAKIIQAINLDNVSINADKVNQENSIRNDYENNNFRNNEDYEEYEEEE
jgi:hypothetical protein